MHTKNLLLILPLLILTTILTLTLTGGTNEGQTGEQLSGEVIVDGSSTVYPVTAAIAEEFAVIQPHVRISVGLSGTGGGFKKFCPGETDISNASRPIKDSEKELCAENGVEYEEFIVALDGLTVMVNPENDWLECLSPEMLAVMLGANSMVVRWSDMDPDYPDEPIKFFIPDPDSGTRDYMTEVVEDAGGPAELRFDDNTTFASDDNVLLDGIANEPYAFGFFGYAYYLSNRETVRAVPIENQQGDCVLPNDESIQSGTYNPLSRPLFIYVNTESLTDKPQLAAYLRFYFADEVVPVVIREVGYSLPPDEVSRENLVRITNLVGE